PAWPQSTPSPERGGGRKQHHRGEGVGGGRCAGDRPEDGQLPNCVGLPPETDGDPRQFVCAGALPLAARPPPAWRAHPPSVRLFEPAARPERQPPAGGCGGATWVPPPAPGPPPEPAPPAPAPKPPPPPNSPASPVAAADDVALICVAVIVP